MNFDNLLRTYARTDLQRFHKQVHYLMREHDPLADRELTEQLIREPVRFELTPREHVAATTLYQLAIYEITSRSIWSKAYPARDIDAPDTSPGTTFDQEREIWGRREYFRTYALAYARMIGEVNLIEHYQMFESSLATNTPSPEPVPVTHIASHAPAWTVKKLKRERGYNFPLYKFLAAAHSNGKPCPTARDVMDAWHANKPEEIANLRQSEFDYYDQNGEIKNTANLNALSKAIKRMTSTR